MSKALSNNLPEELDTFFYLDNPKKIFILSILSCGIYDFLWFYRHWRHYKRRAIALTKSNQSDLVTYPKDVDIIPFWSAFFMGWYIVGVARRIRNKMKSSGFSNFETGPWWAWLFFGNSFLFFFEATADINFNLMIYLLDLISVALSSWQITRLQIKANEYMILSNECPQIVEAHYKKWDLIVLLLGFMLGFFALIGTIFPL